MPRALIVLDPVHGQYNNKHTTKDGFYEGTQNTVIAKFLCNKPIKKETDIPRTGINAMQINNTMTKANKTPLVFGGVQ